MFEPYNDCLANTPIYTAVVLFGYQDTHVTVEESVGKLSVIVTRSGMTNQHFTLTASPVSYDDTFPRLPSEFQYSNLSESNPATCMYANDTEHSIYKE